jgi:hypothetical protein
MSSTFVKHVDPAWTASEQPCSVCGQAYEYQPTIGWIMLGPCDHCADGIPGMGKWRWLEDGSSQWKLNDNDRWRTLSPAQVRIKDTEERAAIEAIRRRRRQN